MGIEARKFSFSTIICGLIALVGSACGDDTKFHGSPETGRNQASADQVQNPLNLTWVWECPTHAYPNIPASDETHIVINGEGPHQLGKENLHGSPVVFLGQICPSQNITRNVVFVIDVSGSTVDPITGTDPLVDGSCNRLKAVQAVMASAIKSGTPTEFAVVTFADDVRAKSTQFYSSENDLFADLTQNSATAIADVICAGGGGTGYENALAGGKSLLDLLAGEKNITREMFFISDGEPSDSGGKAQAEEIKKNALIATVMIGQKNDSVLKNDIASRDERGQPLHERAEKSADLANVLAGFVINKVEKVSIGIRKGKQDKWKKSDVTDTIVSNDFNFEAFKIDTNLYPNGVEIEFSYTDRFGIDQVNKGTLLWNRD